MEGSLEREDGSRVAPTPLWKSLMRVLTLINGKSVDDDVLFLVVDLK